MRARVGRRKHAARTGYRGGHLVDGLGGEPIPGDLAVDGNTITAGGKVDSRGKCELDAEGLTVTPGFIDMHTH